MRFWSFKFNKNNSSGYPKDDLIFAALLCAESYTHSVEGIKQFTNIFLSNLDSKQKRYTQEAYAHAVEPALRSLGNEFRKRTDEGEKQIVHAEELEEVLSDVKNKILDRIPEIIRESGKKTRRRLVRTFKAQNNKEAVEPKEKPFKQITLNKKDKSDLGPFEKVPQSA